MKISLACALMVTAFAGTFGCELLAGVEKRTLGAGGSDDGGPGGEGGGPEQAAVDLSACALTTTGAGKVRVGNLVGSGDRVDFCFRPDSAPTFAGIKPLFQGGGPKCQIGVGYKTVTTTFNLAPGTYEVKAVRAGATSCEGEAIASLPSSVVGDQEAAAFYLFGDGTGAASLKRFAESKPTQQIATKIRVIHAVPNQGAIDLGIADASKAPAVIAATFVKSIPYLATAAPGSSPAGEVDANGYFQRQVGGGRIVFGVAEAGSTTSITTGGRKLDAGTGLTVFFSGRAGSNEFPTEIFTCDQQKGTGLQAACSDASAVNFVVDTVNLQLTGAFVMAEKERKPIAAQEIAKLASDVVCINEVYDQKDKDAIIEAAKAKFPNSYYLKSDIATPPTDARDLAGNVPPLRSTAPCGTRTAKLNNALDCIKSECVQPKGSEQGTAIPLPTGCLQEKCVADIAGLAASTDSEDQACWICLLSQYQSYGTIASARQLCATEPKAVYSFGGQSSGLILSRHPLTETEAYNLPSTDWRSGMLKAKVTLDNGAQVDFYCDSANAVAVDCQTRPYIGGYGGTAPADCIAAWKSEQKLHFTRIKEWARERSGKSRARAVIAGDFYAGPGFDAKQIAAVEPENYELLGNAFALAVPPGRNTECTLCSENPLSQGANTRTRHIFLQDLAITQVRSSETFGKEKLVDYPLSATVTKVPIAQYYGLRSTLRIEP